MLHSLDVRRVSDACLLQNAKLFKEEEEAQLKTLFSFTNEELSAVLDCCCYTFEQAAFTSTGPEPLYDILLSAGFSEAHGKVMGRTWASEAAEYISKLKDQTLGYRSLAHVDYHLNMVVGQSELTRQQEPAALFELSITNPAGAADKGSSSQQVDKLRLEMSHSELYSFFNELERMQQQLDRLSKS